MPTIFTFERGARTFEEVEAELHAAVEQWQDDRERWVSEHLGNPTWRPAESNHSAWSQNPPPDGVEVAQAVKSTWDELIQGAQGYLYRWFDGEFVPVDRFRSGPHDRDGVRDYFLANYETMPFVETLAPDLRAFDERDLIPGSARTLPAEPETDRRRRILALLRDDGRDQLELDELAPLLDDDEYFHLLATRLPTALDVDGPLDDAVLDWLVDDDPRRRARGVRLLDAVTTDWKKAEAHGMARRSEKSLPERAGVDAFELFVEAIPTVDETTQRLVARSLWKPWVVQEEALPPPEHAATLASLATADLPEVRVGAVYGAGRVVGELVTGVHEGASDDAVSEAQLRSAIEAFYGAYEAALADEHPLVRGRAAAMGTSPLCCEWHEDAVIPVRPEVLEHLDFDARWRIARRLAALAADRDSIARRAPNPPFEATFDGNPAAVETVDDYAWDERGPEWERARTVLADHAADAPTDVVEYVDSPLGAVRDGDPVEADLDVLTELVPEAPDEVGSVAPELEALLDHEDDLRPAAARTLHALEYERPTAVTVSHGTIVDALADVRDEYDLVRADRVRELAAADPERSAEVVANAARDVRGDGDRPAVGDFARALHEVSTVAPRALAGVADELGASLSELGRLRLEGYVGLARAARARPAAFAPHAEEIATALSVDRALAKEALATALLAIGEHDPDALPETVRGIESYADAAYEPDEIERLDDCHGLDFEREGAGPLDAVADELLAPD